MEFQKWEYRTEINRSDYAEDWPKDCLNRLGDEGWELTFVLPPSDTPRVFVFKRPAQLPSNIVFTSDLKKTTEDNVPGGLA